jgi:hypothetical protein
MQCEEYVKLRMHFCSAKYRVWRYSNPDTDPRLVSPTGNELQNRLEVAQAELIEFGNHLQSHLSECADCKTTEQAKLPECS